MPEDPFEPCWDRFERVDEHRTALAAIWNEFIEDHPYNFFLDPQGNGVYHLVVEQTIPMPSAFALEFGEWLYNARACLDYIIWATSSYLSGQMPPPDEGALQYPIYESVGAWNRNEYRLKHLAPHHRDMLRRMQPFESDLDANYLGVVNRLPAHRPPSPTHSGHGIPRGRRASHPGTGGIAGGSAVGSARVD